jgi:hypothetical protein
MKRTLLLASLCSFFFATAQQSWPADLQITPEKSNFEKTSTHADVMAFLDAIRNKSPYIQVSTLGKSPAGKDIPLVILSKPAVQNAAEAKASGKPVIYVQGNIHGGEVEGKEVAMMLMRDILLGNQSSLLDHQIILFVPMYNTDGNDKMAKGLRPSQENSPLETGERENGQGLDLNRDGIKAEAPETRALLSMINTWDPQLSVDLHTTNGTWHGYSLTWAPSYLYAGESATYQFTNNTMLPFITEKVKREKGLFFGPFGDFNTREGWPVKNFYTYNHHPRYLVNQFGLRNRMAILSESFAHERFYQRIYSTYTFVTEILSYTNAHAAEIVNTNQAAEKAAIQLVKEQAGKAKKGVRFKMVSTEQPLQGFRAYEYQRFTKPDGSSSLVKTGNIATYNNVNYFGAFKDTVQSSVPAGYIIPAAFANIAAQLQLLGAKLDTIQQPQTLPVSQFLIEKFTRATRKFEGHQLASAEGSWNNTTYVVQKGDFRISLTQPLANLIFYALEPQSDDGLLLWNFFDTYLEEQGVAQHAVAFPILKYNEWPATAQKKGKKK